MTIGPAPQPPVEFPFALSDWQIIDAGMLRRIKPCSSNSQFSLP